MTAAIEVRYNNISGTVGSGGMSSSTTVMPFATVPGFPTIASPYFAKIEIDPGLSTYEIVYLSPYTSGASTGTVLRGQEGTAAVSHSAGATWIHGSTAYDFAAVPGADPYGVLDSTAAIQSAINNSFNGLSVVLPPGIFLIGTYGAGLVGNFFFGAGPGPTVLRAASGFTGNVIQSSTYGSLTAQLDKNGFQVDGVIIDSVSHPYTSPATVTAATPEVGFTTTFPCSATFSGTNGAALSTLGTLATTITNGSSWVPGGGTGTIVASDTTHTFTYTSASGGTLSGCVFSGSQSATVATGAKVVATSFTATIVPGQNTGTGFQAWMAAASSGTPVYAWFADQLCTFTGGTGTVGGTGTLSGVTAISTGGGWTLPSYAGCEVKQYGSGGHGIATCAKKSWVNEVWITSTGGSGIYAEPGANASSPPQGIQFHNGRIENAGRFGIELGPQISDVMISTWSILSISDGFAGILSSGNGDIHIYDVHPTGNNNGMNPAVIVASSSTQIDSLTVDTLTGAPVVLDNTGRWALPGTIKDFQLTRVNFTNPTGALAQFPSPVVSYKARSTNSVIRGGIDKVTGSTGWKYGIANGPFCTLGPAVTASGSFGKITVDSTREFNPLGGTGQFQNTPGTAAQNFSYTGIDYTCVGVQASGAAQILHAAGGTLNLAAISSNAGNTNSPGLTTTADSLFVATTTGLVELAYTSISGTTVTYPSGGWKGSDGYSVVDNTLVFQAHLLGCVATGGATTAINDGALIVETAWNLGNIGYQSGVESSATTFSIGDIKSLNLIAPVFSQNSSDIYNYTTTGSITYPVVTSTVAASPTGTSSTTEVMMGLSTTFTPVSTGNVLVRITGVGSTATGAANFGLEGRYGTGTAPSNGVALTGTGFPQGVLTLRGAVASGPTSFLVEAKITGLTVGTAYWFDLALKTSNASDAASVTNVVETIMEVT
jgi:hypothetical protein